MKYSIVKKSIESLKIDWEKSGENERFSTFAINEINKIHRLGYLLDLQDDFLFS